VPSRDATLTALSSQATHDLRDKLRLLDGTLPPDARPLWPQAMRTVGSLLLATLLATPWRMSFAAGEPPVSSRTFGEPASLDRSSGNLGAALAEAKRAWAASDWSKVRRLLEPRVASGEHLDDAIVREQTLTYLADATLMDTTLDLGVRRQLATTYLTRLIDANPAWQLPTGVFSPELQALATEMRDNREKTKALECLAERNVCLSKAADVDAKLQRLKQEHERLRRAYLEEEVEVRDYQQRRRIWTFVPFGVGHFYNRDPWLGAAFLTVEAAFGAAGLALLIRRNLECDRTRGFAPESLKCREGQNPLDDNDVLRRRRAEEVMGWFFLGVVALDIVIAQIRFRPYVVAEIRRVKRKDLPSLDARSGTGVPSRRRPTHGKKRRARVVPVPAAWPAGVGLAVGGRF